MKNKIDSLHIDGFRSIRKLEIENLGLVTLITGRNNTGKSSVLEAIRLLTADSLPAIIRSILQFREEDVTEEYLLYRDNTTEPYYSLSSLFYGYPAFSNDVTPLQITARGNTRPLGLSMRPLWLTHDTEDDEGTSRLVPVADDLFGSGVIDAFPGIVVETADGKSRILTLDSLTRRMPPPRTMSILHAVSSVPCVFVDPYAGRETAHYGFLWDLIALSDLEKEVITALQSIEPKITAVSMVGGESPRAPRRAIVKVKGRPRPVPMRSFGDGLNHLFGIILSLVNAQNGILLVDEFENGLHHSVQLDAWRTVFRLARKLNIQIVATSHSWDCIEAFQKAAADDPADGVLLRLSRKDDVIIPTVFREKDLAIVTREGIEVR